MCNRMCSKESGVVEWHMVGVRNSSGVVIYMRATTKRTRGLALVYTSGSMEVHVYERYERYFVCIVNG
jgi:hypothetical protein